MITKGEIAKNWLKVNAHLREAKRFLEGDQPDEALYFIWLAAENIVNGLKVCVNGFYSKEHGEKTDILKEYFARDILKKDYSVTFRELSKYRISAAFHPYTSIPKDYTGEDVMNFMLDIQKLKAEAEKILKQGGVMK